MPLSNVVLGFESNPSLQEGSTVCQTVNIIGDDFLEENESFTIVATPENARDVLLGSPTVTITILNDGDGTLYFYACINLFR